MSRLTISRKESQGFTLTTPEGKVVHISIAEVDRKKVRVAIEADPEVLILRDELISHVQPPVENIPLQHDTRKEP